MFFNVTNKITLLYQDLLKGIIEIVKKLTQNPLSPLYITSRKTDITASP